MTIDEATGTAPGGLVVACTLDQAGLAAQTRRWAALRERAELRRLLTASGWRLHFRADEGVLEELEELVEAENRCCAWAEWRVEPLHGEVVLHVTSTDHGVDALHEMFGAQAGAPDGCCGGAC
jgi:hypothetical protein